MRLIKYLGTFLLAVGGFGLLGCGTDNRFERLAEALRNPADIPAEFDLKMPFEIEYAPSEPRLHVRFAYPGGPVDLFVDRTPDTHAIRLEWNADPILEQNTGWSGELTALRFLGMEVHPGLGAEEDAAMTMRYLMGCTEEHGWRCYVEMLDVLAHLGFADTDVYPTLELERAATGLELLAPLADR